MPDNDERAGWAPLPADHDETAAGLLGACPALGSVEQARLAISDMRSDPDGEIYGWVESGNLVAVYGLRRTGPSYQMPWLAVTPSRQGQRYGRSALMDALRHCGRRPMTVEADEAQKGWFERVGFKTVGRRRAPDGGYRYRLGWYAPRRPDEPGYGVH